MHASGKNLVHIEILDNVDDLANFPREALIVLGGGLAEVCVEIHRNALLDAGITNIEVDPTITLYERDVVMKIRQLG